MILAGDIGGTKTTLALFAATRGTAPGFERATATVGNYASRDFAEFHEILRDFLARHRPQLVAGCIGIAGPVRENRCTTTNLPWTVGGAELARLAGLDELRLINDLEAVGYGIDLLPPQEILELQPGAPGARGNRAVIAAGPVSARPDSSGTAAPGSRSRPKAAMRTSRREASSRSSCCGFCGTSTSARAGSASSPVRVSRTSIASLSHREGEPHREPQLRPSAATGDPAAAIAEAAARGESTSPCGRPSSSSGSTVPRPGTWRSR